MTNFNYFKADRVYNELYYQFPKVFLVSDEYRKMTDSTKIAYMLLKARLQAAIAKRQIDEKGNVYFTYTTKELCSVLNCQKQKAIDIKKNLEKYGLLLQKDMGFNKNLGKQNPNRMYLAELNVTENDIYMLEKFDSDNNQNVIESEGMKITPSSQEKNSSEPVVAQEGMKITPSQNVDKSEGMKIIQEFNNSLDTNRHLIDSDKDESQDRLLLENFVELHSNSQRVNATFIPDKVLGLIKTFSPSYTVAQTTVKTIHNAKYKAEQVAGIKIAYEELDDYIANPDQGLYNTVLRAYQKQKTEEVKDMQNVIFTYVKNWFVEYPIQAKKAATENSDLPKVSLYNYLE